jgi:hypothetical protein
MPYSEQTGWLSQTEWNDHIIFCRATGKPEPVAHEPGTPAPQPSKATAAQKPNKPGVQPEGIYNRATGKVTPVTDEMKDTRKVTAKWAGHLMRSCAKSKVRDLKAKDIVSFVVPHMQDDTIHVGRVTDVDRDGARLEVQEHVQSEDGEWVPVNTKHTLDWSDVQQKHTKFPDLEAGDDAENEEEQVRANFREYFTGGGK